MSDFTGAAVRLPATGIGFVGAGARYWGIWYPLGGYMSAYVIDGIAEKTDGRQETPL